MIKPIILFFLFFFQYTAFSQEKVFVVDSIMDVYMRNGYANEHFMPKGRYDKNDKRNGKWKDYEVVFDNVFQEDKKGYPYVTNGMFLVYGKGEYENGKRIGEWDHYVLEDKSFKRIHFKTSTYVNGKQEGEAKYFYPNGVTAGVSKYKKGKLDGKFIQYYQNGKVYATTIFENSLREGVQLNYGKNGNLSGSKNFLNDTLNGAYIVYYEDGKVQWSSDYKMGVEHGWYKYFRENGEIWTKKQYDNGLVMNVITYSETGEELDNGTLTDGNGTLKYFKRTGEIYLIETYENGVVISEDRSGKFDW